MAFTLVELMISVAIIGLLAAIAIPAYQRYIKKSKMSEGYLYLKQIYEGAVIEASQPEIMASQSDTAPCRKKWLFGFFASHIDDNGDRLYIPPRNGKKEKISFAPANNNSFAGPIGNCLYNNEFTNFGIYGFSPASSGNYQVANPGYFAVANAPDNILATQLTNNGVALMGITGNGVFTTNSIWAFADLDGDYNYQTDGGAEDELGLEVRDSGERPNNVTYLMRGIYLDAAGEVQGTAAIYEENLGE